MNKLKSLALHTLEQTLYPDTDKEQWLAYITLKVKYPNITCQSLNGYHCEGIADYNLGIRWEHDKIIDLGNKEVLLVTEPFHKLGTTDIVNTWMRVLGETNKTKRSWFNKILG